jgi:hypothetical protein
LPNSAPLNINIPLTCIESVEVRDLFFLHLFCKDGRFYLVQFSDSFVCKEWAFRIGNAIAPPASIEQVNPFAMQQVNPFSMQHLNPFAMQQVNLVVMQEPILRLRIYSASVVVGWSVFQSRSKYFRF